ncbi:MAG: alpha/beta hydrolase [Acidimicrobiia bacterium]
MIDHFIDTNGIRLHYVEHPGDGPTLLLFPGLNANAVFFQGLVREGLSPALRALAVDLRGRGLSDAPDAGYTMADHAADILGMLDGLEIERAVIAGHSFGGLLTYFLAANHPDRVDKAVVMDAPAEVNPTVIEQIGPALQRLRLVSPSWDEYLANVKAMPYYEGWWDLDLEAYYRADVRVNDDGTVQSRLDPDKIQQALDGTTRVDWSSLAQLIDAPVLMLRATAPFGPPGYPSLVSAEEVQRTMRKLRFVRLVELPGNHITSMFGVSARVAAQAIIDFVGGD